jgi:Glycosyltransferase family 87
MIRAARRAALVLALVCLGTVPAVGAPQTPATVLGPEASPNPSLVTPAATPKIVLNAETAEKIARTSRRLNAWLRDHPIKRTAAVSDEAKREWTVSFIDAKEVVIAVVLVDDARSAVTETRTGPQVAWQMARGYEGAFGRAITEPQIWIPLLVLFLVPLLRWRRLASLHTLDLLVLCGLSVSLVWFNRGEIFTSVPLVYPPMVYLAARLAWVGLRGSTRPAGDATEVAAATPSSRRPHLDSWCPTWLLVTVLLLALGLRLGLNAFDSNVVDVGYAGVIGADRIAHGQTPYGTFPSDCGQCDTYGPLTYLSYVPFELAMPWVGKWNDLPAAHGAAVLFDLIALLGMIVLGWRLGGRRLGIGLGVAWAAFPFTAYALESNSNDTLVAACLVWGLVGAHKPVARGLAVGLAVMSKFSPALLVGLWSRPPFPRATRTRRRFGAYAVGLFIAIAGTGWVLLLDGDNGVRAFWSRTLGYQLNRESPFSIWGQHTWLRPAQIGLSVLVLLFALWVTFRPRRLDLRTFAALSGALIIGMQLTVTHWFYLYIPWFLPFAFAALIPQWPALRPPVAQAPPEIAPEAEVATAVETVA